MHKYHARRTPCNQKHNHHSMKEAGRCNELHWLLKGKQITNLMIQVPILLLEKFEYNGKKQPGIMYHADFVYREKDKIIVEDVKGFETKEYKLKRQLLLYKIRDLPEVKFIET